MSGGCVFLGIGFRTGDKLVRVMDEEGVVNKLSGVGVEVMECGRI